MGTPHVSTLHYSHYGSLLYAYTTFLASFNVFVLIVIKILTPIIRISYTSIYLYAYIMCISILICPPFSSSDSLLGGVYSRFGTTIGPATTPNIIHELLATLETMGGGTFTIQRHSQSRSSQLRSRSIAPVPAPRLEPYSLTNLGPMRMRLARPPPPPPRAVSRLALDSPESPSSEDDEAYSPGPSAGSDSSPV